MTESFLYLTRLGIDTHQEPVVYMREDCHVCRSEGFDAQGRVEICSGKNSIIATLDIVKGDLLSHQKAGLSEAAWRLLGAAEGDKATFRHAPPVESMAYVRGKLYGKPFTEEGARHIIRDIDAGRYSDIQLSAYVTACAANNLNIEETIHITRAMVEAGQRFDWGDGRIVVDKHCVGGLPGNRTTPIVVAIAAANGLTMPKTSSRAITSPAGTADTMETLTRVSLSFKKMRAVVEQEGACLAWGGSVSLSPTDDIIIRVERALDLDSEGQMVASVISKKVAAGSTHVLIDIPVGPTAKVRSAELAERLANALRDTGEALGLRIKTIISDGSQPVGRGVGPALEAYDLLKVLQNQADAPADLRDRALAVTAAVLEMGGACEAREGLALAKKTLESGKAWEKFQAICNAQGGLREPPVARFTHVITSERTGIVALMNNRVISRLASLAGAPNAQSAGLTMHVRLGDTVESGQPLMTLHAEAAGELEYALDFYAAHPEAIHIEEEVV
ncbi:thymidine phosphorylase family protein [Pseudohongiella spirulinae]|uniref:Putative thymidine phosphorylase n=1 Tax=Pseudohongiella spirulinae TaxID=1249552 RepID=A0A0S2KAD8_9GAMM|nr:thymidine phosphorylase family protein [Pseudohongiella spirulinae]ALO45027.1 Putative thymidine phosphorylase [Pseudohongiella spirulinae]